MNVRNGTRRRGGINICPRRNYEKKSTSKLIFKSLASNLTNNNEVEETIGTQMSQISIEDKEEDIETKTNGINYINNNYKFNKLYLNYYLKAIPLQLQNCPKILWILPQCLFFRKWLEFITKNQNIHMPNVLKIVKSTIVSKIFILWWTCFQKFWDVIFFI